MHAIGYYLGSPNALTSHWNRFYIVPVCKLMLQAPSRENKKTVLSQAEPRDAAVHFDGWATYMTAFLLVFAVNHLSVFVQTKLLCSSRWLLHWFPHGWTTVTACWLGYRSIPFHPASPVCSKCSSLAHV